MVQEYISSIISLTTSTVRRNPQYKKHKTWDGDGVLVINTLDAILYDSDGTRYRNSQCLGRTQRLT